MTDIEIGNRIEEWTCVGWRMIGGKCVQYWREPTGRETALVKGSLARHAQPGSVYLVTVTPANRIKTAGQNAPKFLRREQGADTVEWELQSEAALAERDRERQAAKANDMRVLAEALAPVRLAYQRATNRHARAAILAVVIETVMK